MNSIVKALFATFLLGTCSPGFGQKADAVSDIMIRSVSDTTMVEKKLANARAATFDFPDSARKIAHTALFLSRRLQYQLGMGSALHLLGALSLNAGRYDSAVSYFQKALVHLDKAERPVNISIPYIGMASAYFNQGKYYEALMYSYQALRTKETHHETKITAPDSILIYLNIASIWDKMGGTKQAANALTAASNIKGLYSESTHLARYYGMIGRLKTNGNLQKAIAYFKKAISVANAKAQKGLQISGLNTIASIYISLNQSDSAYAYTQKAFSMLNRYPNGYNYDRFHARNNLGRVYLLQKKYKLAEKTLKSLYKELQELNLQDILIKVEFELAELYKETGQHRMAAQHYKRYAQMKDSMVEQQNLKAVGFLLQLRKSEHDKVLVAKELRIVQQQRTIEQKNFWIWAVTIGLLLLCAALIAFFRTYRQKQKFHQAMLIQLRQEKEISQLKARITGEEEERNRIAIELHDNVGSLLTTASYSLETLNHRQPAENELKKLSDIVQAISRDIRNTSHRLMPDVLLRQGLPEAIIQYGVFIERSTGLHIDTQIQGTFDRVPKEIQLYYFRILQELLQNTLKHAQAKRALVHLHASEAILSLTVEDDGIGFDHPLDQSKGKGLKNIENRLKIWNGHINYESTAQQGTFVYVEINLENLFLKEK